MERRKEYIKKFYPSLLVSGSGFIKIFINYLETEERIEVAKPIGDDLTSQAMRNFRKPHRTERQGKKTAEASYSRYSQHNKIRKNSLGTYS